MSESSRSQDYDQDYESGRSDSAEQEDLYFAIGDFTPTDSVQVRYM